MGHKTPKVSVIMSTYRDDPFFLCEAIESILNQTFTDFEFIIVNDCGSLSTADILNKYAKLDTRIIIINNEKNLGLTKSLNRAMRVASGDYLARMDADDISLPDRLLVQYTFLQEHSDYCLVGSAFKEKIGDKEILQRLPLVLDFGEIKRQLIRFNLFCHASVMLRRDCFFVVGGYDESLRFAQDYDLWLRISARFKVANLDSPLVVRRMDKNISLTKERHQKLCAVRSQAKAIIRGDYPWYCAWYVVRPLVVICTPKLLLRFARNIKYGEV